MYKREIYHSLKRHIYIPHHHLPIFILHHLNHIRTCIYEYLTVVILCFWRQAPHGVEIDRVGESVEVEECWVH